MGVGGVGMNTEGLLKDSIVFVWCHDSSGGSRGSLAAAVPADQAPSGKCSQA